MAAVNLKKRNFAIPFYLWLFEPEPDDFEAFPFEPLVLSAVDPPFLGFSLFLLWSELFVVGIMLEFYR